MRRVSVLTEAVLRAWGFDDPRVLSHLRAENQAGTYRRTKAVGERAGAAGWPVEAASSKGARDAQIRALRRLERMDHTPKGQRDKYLSRKRAAAAQPTQAQVNAYITDWLADDEPPSIYDE